ncbi:MAG: carbohydrate kinase family protein [Verrucomicrobia bacterium]|nr:carbohydrate kinase family protein [Verrucomicrobiota bacterium]
MVNRKGILAAGNWVIDRVKIVDRWPEQDTLALIESEALGTGGAPYNVLVGLARLHAPLPLAALGLVGNDPNGQLILHDCQHHGINTQHLRIAPSVATSYTDVMTVRSTGRRTFFHNHGANALLAPEHFDPRQTSCKIFHLGYLLLLNGLDLPDPEFGTRAARVLAAHRAVGIKTSVDVVSELSNRFVQIVPPALKHADYCILNELEAGHTTGHVIRQNETLRIDAARGSARKLLDMGVHELVVIHFPEGAYALAADGRECLRGSLNLPDGYIQGTVGAGDAFCGGMLYGLHEGWTIEDCLKLAVCNAAGCLAHATATQGIRALAETLGLCEKFGYRQL